MSQEMLGMPKVSIYFAYTQNSLKNLCELNMGRNTEVHPPPRNHVISSYHHHHHIKILNKKHSTHKIAALVDFLMMERKNFESCISDESLSLESAFVNLRQ